MSVQGSLLLALLRLTGALEVFVHSPQKAPAGSDVLLQCSFSIANPPVDPKYLAILWRYKKELILRYDTKGLVHQPRVSFNKQATTAGNASISVANVTLEDGGKYTCTVIYSPETKNEDITLNVLVPPVIQIPNKVAVAGEQKILLCSATGFHPPHINITWLRDGEVLTNSQMGKIQRNDDGTYSVNSTVTIKTDINRKNQTFTCRVHHETHQEPFQESFQLVYEDAKSNVATVISVTVVLLMVGVILAVIIYWKRKQKYLKKGGFKMNNIEGPNKLIDKEDVTLCCIRSNCAQNTRVTWLEQTEGHKPEIIWPSPRNLEEEQLLDGSYDVCENQEGSRSYSTSLRFIFCLKKHKGVTFICRVTSDNETQEKHFHCKNVYAKSKLIKPVKPSLCVSGEILYSLHLNDFYPRDIRIRWSCVTRERQETISSEEQYEENPDLTFSVCSEARFSEEFFKDPECKVCVTWEHGSMDGPETEEMSMMDPDFIWTPVVEAIQTPQLLHGTRLNLECKISEYFPDALTVNWFIKYDGDQEETLMSERNFTTTSKRETDLKYSCSTILSDLPIMETHQGVEYMCRVQHPSEKKETVRKTGKLKVMAKPYPMEPIKMTLVDNSRVQFYLNLQGFHPKDIEIIWCKENGGHKSLLSPTNTLTDAKDRTFSADSECSIVGSYFNNPQNRVIVEWKHESLDVPGLRSWSGRDFPWRPVMEDITIPKLEAAKPVTLSCEISGYFPDSLSVEWIKMQNGNKSEIKLPTKDYKITDIKAHKKEDNTLACQARLTFTPHLERDQGAEFICRVTHPTLEEPREKRTGPLLIEFTEKPKISDIKPSTGATFSLEVDRFYPPNIQISWRQTLESCRDQWRTLSSSLGDIRKNTDGTYSTTGTCEIHGSNEDKVNYILMATVEHKSQESPAEKTLILESENGKLKPKEKGLLDNFQISLRYFE